MDIRLNARLSAYGKVSPPKACTAETVTNEDIDLLFKEDITAPSVDMLTTNNKTVSKEEIDLLFTKR